MANNIYGPIMGKRVKKLCIIDNGSAAGWTGSTRTMFTVEINHSYISVQHKSGRDMFTYEVNTAIGRILQEHARIYGITYQSKRENPFRFCYNQGASGCQDVFIEEIKDDFDFPERRFMFHESCYGKTSGFCTNLYDYLDLAVISGFLQLKKDEEGCRYYAYDPEKDAMKDLSIKMINPREISKEDGWMYSIDLESEDARVIPLRIIREQLTPIE